MGHEGHSERVRMEGRKSGRVEGWKSGRVEGCVRVCKVFATLFV